MYNYNHIFFNNVMWLLNERRMTKKELASRSGVSISFLSDLTTGKANPSLKVMELIAKALEIPLPRLLESNLGEHPITSGEAPRSLPPGYERVSAILPLHLAVLVKKWDEATRKKLGELTPGDGGTVADSDSDSD